MKKIFAIEEIPSDVKGWNILSLVGNFNNLRIELFYKISYSSTTKQTLNNNINKYNSINNVLLFD